MGGKAIVRRLQSLRLKRSEYNKTKTDVARVTLSAGFYIPFTGEFDENDWLSWDATPQLICDAISEYMGFVDEIAPTLQWEHWVGSAMKNVTRKRLDGVLRGRPSIVEWDGKEDSEESIGEYGVSALFSSSRHTLTTWPKRTAHLRIDFPVTADIEEVAALFTRLAEMLPIGFAHLGYMFKEEPARWRGTTQIRAKSKTFTGVAPGSKGVSDDALGHTYTAHWMNALSEPLMDSLKTSAGGLPVFKETQVSKSNGTWIFRTSEMPLAGNVVKGKRELGGMPELAAFLRPLREVSDLWSARFDEL